MIKVTGKVGAPAVFAIFLLNLAIYAWFIYLVVKVAQHVNAWPF